MICSTWRTYPSVYASDEPSGPNADRKSTRLNSSHSQISYAVFCLKKKKISDMDTLSNAPSRHCCTAMVVGVSIVHQLLHFRAVSASVTPDTLTTCRALTVDSYNGT